MHDGNDRDHETAFPKKYGQMAQQAHQLPHLLGQSKPRTTKLSKLEFDTVNRTSPQLNPSKRLAVLKALQFATVVRRGQQRHTVEELVGLALR